MKRLYGVFRRVNGKWERVPGTGAYYKETAIRVFQDLLLSYVFGGEYQHCLKPVKE